ncbi:MAG: NTP transferase domain-containing protein, partial [Deltaproteobacteria bacterium]|nr:NTP transferase domain-containing protein [Deltaproteobacteria bacterium]
MPQTHAGSAALVLAAGGGTRLGGGKLLLPWKGRPLVAHVVEKVLGLPDLLSVIVVLGHHAGKLQSCLEAEFPTASSPPLRIARNP